MSVEDRTDYLTINMSFKDKMHTCRTLDKGKKHHLRQTLFKTGEATLSEHFVMCTLLILKLPFAFSTPFTLRRTEKHPSEILVHIYMIISCTCCLLHIHDVIDQQ